MFGNIEDVVVTAKLWRHSAELFLIFDVVLCSDVGELKNGVVQLQQH